MNLLKSVKNSSFNFFRRVIKFGKLIIFLDDLYLGSDLNLWSMVTENILRPLSIIM